MTRRNIDIPDELWHWISIEAAKQKKSKRQLVIDALKEYKERRKNK
jgi:predicted HicB family RNase H-like nuclease